MRVICKSYIMAEVSLFAQISRAGARDGVGMGGFQVSVFRGEGEGRR